ncbi:hypothetical protein [Hymenobacter yonginensis]|uniref:Uncharacterized protein n=1 Tax=Hymenobacter yonginensis TaxID=748197 RepID=A0ABY7PPB7_9BACT|nr:hypothetical protein [Hymenobacter yonginensis]WBO85116.1 hypothetical protein O9Z63_02480 [Hymenobacter yonginensis]
MKTMNVSSKILIAMHGQALTDKILEHLHRLRAKPSTLIAFEEEDLPYELLAIHLYGYLDGIATVVDRQVFHNWQRWQHMQNQISYSGAVAYIPEIHEQGSFRKRALHPIIE